MKSWKTTLLGIFSAAAILIPQLVALIDGDPSTIFELSVVFAALGIGGAGVVARDNGVSSEDAGVK
jgi:hypothetical protein